MDKGGVKLAATLFKLAITASTQTSVTTKPDVKKYFYEFDSQDIDSGTGVLTILATDFVDEAGDPVTTITEVATDNGYYLLFVNGVLQQDALYTVSDASVIIPDADTMDIEEEAPIILVVTNFAPEATSTTTVNT
jgi:hypothetical protein